MWFKDRYFCFYFYSTVRFVMMYSTVFSWFFYSNQISRQPKMEKADILEMTVRYLKEVQSSSQDGQTSPTTQISQYHAGYSECLGEASSFLANCETIDLETRLRIMNHLADRCSNLDEPGSAPHQAQQHTGSYYHPSVAASHQQPTATPHQSAHHHQTRVASPAASPVTKATNSSTRVPPMTYVPQQLMLCIPSDFAAHTNPSLLSQSSTQSSIIFPTPPPSPSPVECKPAQQYTRLPSPAVSQYKNKAKSAVAMSYRRHNVISHAVVTQENVWRPW